LNTAPKPCGETPLHIIRRFTQYWRNDYAGVEQWSHFIREGNYCYHTQLYEQHENFAKLWDKNLDAQHFVEAFTDKCILS
jgi:hypothetical protein